MFQTIDSLRVGKVFWRSLEAVRRPPFDPMSSGHSATLVDQDRGLALLVAPSDDEAPDQRLFVQLRDVANDAILVDAVLDSEFQYLSGEALGLPADEVAAAEALTMYGPEIKTGEWTIMPGDEGAFDDDDQAE